MNAKQARDAYDEARTAADFEAQMAMYCLRELKRADPHDRPMWQDRLDVHEQEFWRWRAACDEAMTEGLKASGRAA